MDRAAIIGTVAKVVSPIRRRTITPSSLGGVLDEHEEQRAEPQAQKEQERHEPGEQELLGIGCPKDRAGHSAQDRDDRGDHGNAVPRVPRRDRDLVGPQRDGFVAGHDSGLHELDASRA